MQHTQHAHASFNTCTRGLMSRPPTGQEPTSILWLYCAMILVTLSSPSMGVWQEGQDDRPFRITAWHWGQKDWGGRDSNKEVGTGGTG